MPTKTELGFFAFGLAVKHALRVGGALVGLVAALLSVEIDRRIARIIILGVLDFVIVAAIFAHKALQAGPRLDQRAIHREMLITGPAFLAREIINLGKEQFGHFHREHSLVILTEHTVIKAALAKVPIQKPQPKQIVGELFAEKPLAAHTIKGHQDAALEQLLRWNTWPSTLSVELVKQSREFLENGIDSLFDSPQRVVRRNPAAKINHGQKIRLSLRFSAHGDLIPSIKNLFKKILLFQQPARVFTPHRTF